MEAPKKRKSKKKSKNIRRKIVRNIEIKIIYEIRDKHDAYRSNKGQDIVEDEVCNLGT